MKSQKSTHVKKLPPAQKLPSQAKKKSHHRGASVAVCNTISLGPSTRSKSCSGYVFMVRQGEDMAYRPIRIDSDNSVSVVNYPSQVFDRVTDDMREFWKRAVIDDAIRWDAYSVDVHTLKLVKIEVSNVDCTREVFTDRDNMVNMRKNAALSKLEPDEARMLGLEKDYSLMKLFQRPDADDDDVKMLQRMRASSSEFTCLPD